jgi:hypothetical protein
LQMRNRLREFLIASSRQGRSGIGESAKIHKSKIFARHFVPQASQSVIIAGLNEFSPRFLRH